MVVWIVFFLFRSISLLYESERTGQATAEELLRQKEQLKQTESRLTDINSTLKQSERHLQGIKSVFGGIRNYFKGGPAAAGVPGAAPMTAGASSRLSTSASAGIAVDSAISQANDIRYLQISTFISYFSQDGTSSFLVFAYNDKNNVEFLLETGWN